MLQMVEQQRQKLCIKLSYSQLKEYLSILVENNLIESQEETQIYKTTDKGLNLLKMYNEIEELLQTITKNNN